jgi:adenylosuccinate synthase
MNNTQTLTERRKTIAVVCNQWGDSGKGKIVDILAAWADIIVRGTGGNNAGHTMVIKGKKHVQHLLPSGILWDKDGKKNIIGNGVAFNPQVVRSEIKVLIKEDLSFNNLMFAYNAHLVLPQHLVMDRAKESSLGVGKIGTTGKGMGPVYTDHYARIGLIVNDMLNPDVLRAKLKRNLEDKVKLLKLVDLDIIKQIMLDDELENGEFFHPEKIFDIDAIVDRYRKYGVIFKDMIRDTDTYVREAIGKKNVLLEGAQGLLLSIDRGIHPGVTSSDSSVIGLAHGAGIKEGDVDLNLGIVKFPYMTRVGEGPFPTEMGGKKSAVWCRDYDQKAEKESYPDVTINDLNELEQGIAVRQEGKEFGATTGRLRRTGWIDLPLLRYALLHSDKYVVLTKADVLDKCKAIKICVKYIYQGADYQYGNKTLKKGDFIYMAIPRHEIIDHCEPVYVEFPGWVTSLREIRKFDDLPNELKTIIGFVESETGMTTKVISVGPDRNETIFV